jgi:hypothetical protein
MCCATNTAAPGHTSIKAEPFRRVVRLHAVMRLRPMGILVSSLSERAAPSARPVSRVCYLLHPFRRE